MAITLGAITLPQGLRWVDELTWTPLAQVNTYLVTGSLLVQQATKQAGRPITLLGGDLWAWMTYANVKTLKASLDDPAVKTLTLHDSRTFQVLPAGPIECHPLPVVMDSGFANPPETAWWVIDKLSFFEAPSG